MKVTRRQATALFLAILAGSVVGFSIGRYFYPAQPNTDTTNLHYCYHFVANSKNVPAPFNQFLQGDNGTYVVYVCRMGP